MQAYGEKKKKKSILGPQCVSGDVLITLFGHYDSWRQSLALFLGPFFQTVWHVSTVAYKPNTRAGLWHVSDNRQGGWGDP